MALIKCPECGKEISDRAKQCIHCGYPLDERDQVDRVVNQTQLYKVVLIDSGVSKVKTIKVVREITGLGLVEAKDIVDSIPQVIQSGLSEKECEMIQSHFLAVGATAEIQNDDGSKTENEILGNAQSVKANINNATTNAIIKCPTCQSTDVKRISGTRRLMAGLAFILSPTARSQFECKNCGYKW